MPRTASMCSALLAAALLAPALPTSAQPQTYIRALVADDGADLDLFGFWCSLRGNIACVGAVHEEDGGDDCGAAYLFDITTGQQLHKLVPSDAHAQMTFGFCHAVGDGLVAIGAPGASDPVHKCGAAYLFDVATGQQLAKITPPDPGVNDQFGQAFAFHGDYLFVGGPFRDSFSGRMYVYDISDPAAPALVTSFAPPDVTPGSVFANAITIDGDRALIGAPVGPNNDGVPTGVAYLYDISNPAAPAMIRKFEPWDGWALDTFGSAVALRGDTALIGAHQSDALGMGSGAAYLFDVNTGQQLSTMLAFDDDHHTGLGSGVWFVGNIAVLGAVYDDTFGGDAGSVYLFDITDRTAPVLINEFGAPTTDGQDAFGISVAVEGNKVLVGANRAGPGTHIGPGAVYLFEIDAGTSCPADWDSSGSVNSADISAFLSSWLDSLNNNNLNADFDNSGSVNSADISAFLNQWLADLSSGSC